MCSRFGSLFYMLVLLVLALPDFVISCEQFVLYVVDVVLDVVVDVVT